ncbi:MAG: hypothetical protein O6949_12610 [Chloroflexi bacterium]|nr:hypothetical protein [Chloroflexota bacterium]
MVDAEPLAGSPEAAQDFVHDQQGLVSIANGLDPLPKLLAALNHSAGPSVSLQQDCGDANWSFELNGFFDLI